MLFGPFNFSSHKRESFLSVIALVSPAKFRKQREEGDLSSRPPLRSSLLAMVEESFGTGMSVIDFAEVRWIASATPQQFGKKVKI